MTSATDNGHGIVPMVQEGAVGAMAADPHGLDPVDAENGRSSQTLSETILVVDDEEGVREFVTQVLESRGYRVLAAESGASALQKWCENDPQIDLLLTDIIMPGGISGAELAERLQIRQPGLKVIYASGYSPGMGTKELAVLNRPNFLPKPYGIEKLLETVRASLDRT